MSLVLNLSSVASPFVTATGSRFKAMSLADLPSLAQMTISLA